MDDIMITLQNQLQYLLAKYVHMNIEINLAKKYFSTLKAYNLCSQELNIESSFNGNIFTILLVDQKFTKRDQNNQDMS